MGPFFCSANLTYFRAFLQQDSWMTGSPGWSRIWSIPRPSITSPARNSIIDRVGSWSANTDSVCASSAPNKMTAGMHRMQSRCFMAGSLARCRQSWNCGSRQRERLRLIYGVLFSLLSVRRPWQSTPMVNTPSEGVEQEVSYLLSGASVARNLAIALLRDPRNTAQG